MTIIEIKDDKKNCTRSILFQGKTLFTWFRSRLFVQKIEELKRIQQNLFALSDAKEGQAQGFLRDIQLCQLHLLKAFDCFAKKNDITYWLDFGTLIGAARSRSFIPWDDDIDVSTPRESYSKIWEKRLDLPKGFILDYNDNKSLLKLRHVNLPGIISLDIFPVDFITNDYDPSEGVEITGKIHNFQKQTKPKSRCLMTRRAAEELQGKLPITTNNFDESRMICYGLEFGHYSHPSIFIPNSIVFPLKMIEFEGSFYPAPRDHDRHLIYLYKNWKQADCSHKGHVFINDLSVVDLLKIRDYIEHNSLI